MAWRARALLVLAAAARARAQFPSCTPLAHPRFDWLAAKIPIDLSSSGSESCPPQNCMVGEGFMIWDDILSWGGQKLGLRLTALTDYVAHNTKKNGKFPLDDGSDAIAPYGSLNQQTFDRNKAQNAGRVRTVYEMQVGRVGKVDGTFDGHFYPVLDVPTLSLTIFDIDNLEERTGDPVQNTEILCFSTRNLMGGPNPAHPGLVTEDTLLRVKVREPGVPDESAYPNITDCRVGEMYVTKSEATDTPNPTVGQYVLEPVQLQSAITLTWHNASGIDRIHFSMFTPCTKVRPGRRARGAARASGRLRAETRAGARCAALRGAC